MPRIKEELVEEILSKTDIVDVIGEKVSLSKKGKSYFGLCPFHQEKTPSFSVEPNRKIYNCFSCGEKGNAVTFLQKTENMTYVEALEELAKRAHVDIDFQNYKKEDPYKNLYQINLDAMQFYEFYLKNTVSGKDARSYLQERGITDEIMAAFHIGLAPSEYDTLYQTMIDKGHVAVDLHRLGLIKTSKQESFYDLFRSRIIFPILDENNKVLAFSGRTYLGEDGPKYINSPQTDVFTKSTTLYNLNNAVFHIKKHKRLILTEGYMDAIAFYRAGMQEVVASMGTSLTKDQVRKMAKYTKEVYIAYDGDSAGLEATSRAISMLEQEHLQVKIVLLPDQADPDDYIKRYSEEALKDFTLHKWMDPLEFHYNRELKQVDPSKLMDIEGFKKTIFDLIKHTSHTVIDHYLSKLSRDIQVSLESLKQDFEQYTKRFIKQASQTLRNIIPIDSKYAIAERKLLNYFMIDRKYFISYNNKFDELFFIDPKVRDIKMIIEDRHYELYEEDITKRIGLEELLERLNEDQKAFFLEKVYNKYEELMDEEYMDYVNTIEEYVHYATRIKELEEEIKKAETIEDKIHYANIRDKTIKEVKHG
jgi:DNA primase